MEEDIEIKSGLTCNQCDLLAKHYCKICFKSFVCDAHKSSHCSQELTALNSRVSHKIALSVKQKLDNLTKTTNGKISKLQANYIICQKIVKEMYDKCLDPLIKSLQMIEKSLSSFIAKDCLYVRDHLILQEICEALANENYFKDRLWQKDAYYIKESDENFANFKKMKNQIVELCESLSECNHESPLVAWEECKKSIENSNIESFNDLVLDLEDAMSRVMTEKLEINSSLFKNSQFLFKLNDVCPNICKVHARIRAVDIDLLAGVLIRLKKLSHLEIEVIDSATPDSSLLFKKISDIKRLRYLTLKNFDVSNLELQSKEVRLKNLVFLNLIKNGSKSSSLVPLFGLLSSSLKLSYVSISQNILTKNNLTSLQSLVQTLPRILYLSLSQNKTSSSISSLASLISHKSLESFHLHSNQISLQNKSDLENSLSQLPCFENSKKLVLSPNLSSTLLQDLQKKNLIIHLQMNSLFLGPFKA